MYTAISIDVFIAAYSGALGGFTSGRRGVIKSAAHYALICEQCLAFAEAFDTQYAAVMPNELQLENIESVTSEFFNGYAPPQTAASFTAANYDAGVIIALLNESDAVVAANVTNPIPVPAPVSFSTINIPFVVGLATSLRSTVASSAIGAIVDGYTAAGDGGGGTFYYDVAHDNVTAPDNGGTVIVPTARVGLTGAWIRVYEGRVEAQWFGGMPNAFFQNPATGAWYQDAGFAIPATDDAPKAVLARNYIASLPNGGELHFAGANWYMVQPLGPNNEFVLPCDNLTVSGDGDATVFRVAPGLNTVLKGGWSAIFGDWTTGPGGSLINSYDNVYFRDFLVDGNSDFNQWPGPNFGGVANHQNSAVAILGGNLPRYSNVSVVNFAGAFMLVMGNYARPELLTNGEITDCKSSHIGDDPNIGDASFIACGAINYSVTNCIVDCSGSVVPIAVGTAMECHGTNYHIEGNIVYRAQRGLNIAADNTDAIDCKVIGNTFSMVINGITRYQIAASKFENLDIAHNTIVMRQSPTLGVGETGIADADPSSFGPGVGDGNGFVNCKITDNMIVFGEGTPTAGSAGMNLLGNHFNTQIENNFIQGFDGFGILIQCTTRPVSQSYTRSGSTLLTAGQPWLNGNQVVVYSTGALSAPLKVTTPYYVVNSAPGSFQLSLSKGGAPITLTSAGTGTQYVIGNQMPDLSLTNNHLDRNGQYGYFVGGKSEIIANVLRLTVTGCHAVDARTPSSLQDGVRIQCFADTQLRCWKNFIYGATGSNLFLDTGTFPTLVNTPETTEGNYLTTGIARAGVAVVAGSTSATPLQALHVVGTALITTNIMQRGDNSAPAMGWGDHWASLSTDVVWLELDGVTPLGFLSSTGLVLGIAGHLTAGTYVQVGGATGPILNEGAASPETIAVGSPGDAWLGQNGLAYMKHTGVATNTGWLTVLLSGLVADADIAAAAAIAVTKLAHGTNGQQLLTIGAANQWLGVTSQALGDSSPTITVGNGNQAILPAATLTGNQTVTLGAGGAVANEVFTILRLDATAHTLAVVNGGPGAGTLYTFPISTTRQASFQFNGTDWAMIGTEGVA
jgi:hypothetical protein